MEHQNLASKLYLNIRTRFAENNTVHEIIDNFTCSSNIKHWRTKERGGGGGATDALPRSNFFHLHTVFGENFAR